MTQVWVDQVDDSPFYNWTTDAQFETMTFELSGDVLDLLSPSGQIVLTRTEFSAGGVLVGTWDDTGDNNDQMGLEADGTFWFSYGNGTQSGRWDASSGYLRSVVESDTAMAGDFDWGWLNPYSVVDVNTVDVTYAGDVVHTFQRHVDD